MFVVHSWGIWRGGRVTANTKIIWKLRRWEGVKDGSERRAAYQQLGTEGGRQRLKTDKMLLLLLDREVKQEGVRGGTTTTTLQHEEHTNSSVGSRNSRKSCDRSSAATSPINWTWERWKYWGWWHYLWLRSNEELKHSSRSHIVIVHHQFQVILIKCVIFMFLSCYFFGKTSCVSGFIAHSRLLLHSFFLPDSSFGLMTWAPDDGTLFAVYRAKPLILHLSPVYSSLLLRRVLWKPWEFKMEPGNSMLFSICVKLQAWSLNS